MALASDEELGRGRKSEPITPHDTDVLPAMRGIHVGTGGNLVGCLRDDDPDDGMRTYIVNDGSFYPYDFRIVHTDSDADDLIAIR